VVPSFERVTVNVLVSPPPQAANKKTQRKEKRIFMFVQDKK